VEIYGEEQQSSSAKTPVIDGYVLYKSDQDLPTNVKRRKRLSKLLSRFVTIYSEQLESHPIRTKSLTAGILTVLGDLLAQGIEQAFHETSGLDGRRIFAMFIEGFCFSGPMMHFAYEAYEHLFPIVSCDYTDTSNENDSIEHAVFPVAKFKTVWRNVLIHVAFDQIFMATFYVFGFMIITAVVEGHASDMSEELQNDYFRNLGASWLAAALFFAPLQIFAFAKLNKEFRVLATNMIDILWVTVMSIVTHLHRDQSESFIKTVLIPMLETIGQNIVDST
jgi:hypothetical protein